MKTIHTLLSALAILTVAFACKPENNPSEKTEPEDQQPAVWDGFGTDYADTTALLFVDMGTGMDWATKNTGAEKSSDYGNYEEYDGPNVLILGQSELTNTVLPSREQWRKLFDVCKKNKDGEVGYTQWGEVNGKKGILMRSSANGNRIFIPAAGFQQDNAVKNTGDLCLYWTGEDDESITQGSLIVGVYVALSTENERWSIASRNRQTVKLPMRLVLNTPE
ncbi:MAG: hypothetical protein K6G39_07955 [Bacteroidales bacterium]|nr:hypothetical protein [Bacteroidales bacterium]